MGERRALSLESWDGTDRQALQDEIDRLIHQERIDYLELPDSSDLPAVAEMEAAEISGRRQIPSNQLAHGAWYVRERWIVVIVDISHLTLNHPFYSCCFLSVGEKC